jgi:hypothetical protein
MNLEPTTLNILKNFSIINPSIFITKGDVIKTISVGKTILGHAKVPQTFDRQFAIYDLPNFLSALSMFDKPVIEFESDAIAKISSEDDSRAVNYNFCDPELIVIPPDKNVLMGTVNAQFDLKSKSLSDIVKAIGIFNLPEIAIVGDGENITIRAVDSKKTGSSYYDIVGKSDKTFNVILRGDSVKQIMNADYSVEVGSCVHFKGTDIEYWLTIEPVKRR